MHRLKSLLQISSLLVASAFAQTSSPDGVMEKIALVSPTDLKTWSAAECTATPSGERARIGPSSWHWHVDVDHLAGEPKYPIGWPRISHTITDGPLRDWSGWEFLHMWIFVATSREALPGEPAGLGLLTPDRASGYNRPLRELKKDQWIELNIPVAQIPRHGDVRQIQFHVAEANYRHGDRLDFFINDLALTRYAEPVLFDLVAENAVVFSDTMRLPVRFQMLGLKPGAHASVGCELRRDGQTAARVSVDATAGAQRVVLDLGGKKLAPGNYELRASMADGGRVASTNLRVVESPWR